MCAARTTEKLNTVIDRIVSGEQTEADGAELLSALLSRQIVMAHGQGSVTAGRDISQSIIITGDIYQGADAERVCELLSQKLSKIEEDAHQRSLLDYFSALRHHCANFPYLSLISLPGSSQKTLNEIYVPPHVRRVTANGVEDADLTIEELLLPIPDTPDKIHVLLLGEAGAGKSSAMRQIALRSWDNPAAIRLDRPHIPMIVKLQALASVEGALDTRLLNALYQSHEFVLSRQPPADYFTQWSRIMNAPWLLLFDGLDEVPTDQRPGLLAWLKAMLASFQKERHRVVIGSRHIADSDLLSRDQFSVFELQPFLPEQRQEFAGRWFGDQASAFVHEMKSVEDGEMPGTPLLLTIAASVYSHDGSLPDNPARLYERYIDIWLAEAKQQGLRNELEAELTEIALPLLENLALSMTENLENISKQSLIPVAADFIRRSLSLSNLLSEIRGELFLEVMGRRSGVFSLRDETVEWGHPSFREYLAARALERQRDGAWNNFALLIAGKSFSDRWAEALGKLAQITAEPIELVKRLCAEAVQGENEESVSLVKECWRMSSARDDAEARSAVVEMVLSSFRFTHSFRRDNLEEFLVEIGPQIFDQLLAAMSSPDASMRRTVVDILGRIGDPRAIDPLIRLFDDPDWSVSSKSYEAIGLIGEPAIHNLLVIINDTSKSVDERAACLWGLNRIGIRSREISQTLGSCLKEGMDGKIKLLQTGLLISTSLRDVQQTSYAQAALSANDGEIVRAAAKFLTEMPTESALPSLVAAFRRWSAPASGSPNTSLLRQIIAAVIPIDTPDAKETSSRLVQEHFPLIMKSMSETSIWSPDSPSVPEAHSLLLEDLATRLSQDSSDDLIWSSIRQLRMLWHPDHLTILAATAEHLSARGTDLEQLMVDGIVQGMQSKTQHIFQDEAMQVSGLELSAKCRMLGSTTSISKLLDLNDWTIDVTVGNLLWVSGDMTAEDELLKKLTQPLSNIDLEYSIVRALGTCGTWNGAKAVIQHLHNAPELKANLGREAMAPLILRGFVSPEQIVELTLNPQASILGRIVSAETMGYLRTKGFGEALRTLISQDEDERLLVTAIEAIYKIQDASAIPDLEALLLKTESENVASSVAYSLHRLEARQSIPAIKKAIEKFGLAGDTHLLTTLAWFQDSFVIPSLREAISGARNPFAPPLTAIESVGRFLPEDWAREILLTELETWHGVNFDNSTQLYAVRTLARSEPNLLLERVISLYDTGHLHESARREVINWLPKLSSKASINQELLLEVLKRLICDRSLVVRELVGETLDWLPQELCHRIYTELRRSAYEWSQGCAVFSLGYFGDSESEINSSRFAERFMVRHFAGIALQTYRRRQALKRLITLYQAPDGIDRLSAYLSISEKGDEGTIWALYEAIAENEMPRTFLRQLSEKVNRRLSNERRTREKEEKERMKSKGAIQFD
jgi:HEAT repeat protein